MLRKSKDKLEIVNNHTQNSKEKISQQDNNDYTHKNYKIGHRKRLKERFLKNHNNLEAIFKYELLELLLFQVIPRKDVKDLAKDLLDKFGSVNGVIHADSSKLLKVKGVSQKVLLQFKIIRTIINNILKERVEENDLILKWSDLVEYLKFSSGHEKIEHFRVLFMNGSCELIADEIISTGTINRTSVYPREIVKHALFYEASALILVHNHPGKNTQPSDADIITTKNIISICNPLNIKIYDHVIVSYNNYYSFKNNLII
ncbi:MAG TPA: DNA repair protein RadC [Candidatus Megaira endosymbiont of Hartmannula sinica]|nr:DNA repair protein RadC [Candidatus Megaera endosymbiont of Hartmannula sinica]